MSDENIQEAEVIENTGTEIKEFSDTEAGLAELKERYCTIPDCTTKEGYEEARKGVSVLTSTRTSLDKMRLGLNAGDQARIKARNKEAARILELILEIETPLRSAKNAIDDEEERIKAEEAAKEEKRVLDIETEVKRIHELSNCPRTMEAITRALSEAEKIDPNDGFFEEFMPAAKIAKDTATVALQELRDEAQLLVDEANRVAEEAEKQAEEQKRLDAEREAIEVDKKAAQDKLDAQQVEMDKKQKAMDDQQAEIDRQEKAKKDAAAKEEQDLIDKEKTKQEEKNRIEHEEREHKEKLEEMAKNKELYANDAEVLFEMMEQLKGFWIKFSNKISKTKGKTIIFAAIVLPILYRQQNHSVCPQAQF